MVRATGGKYYWELQAMAAHTIAPPVQNTWYEILSTQLDCRVYWIRVLQDNTDNVAKNMEARITIDGNVVSVPATGLNDNTAYYVCWVVGQTDALEFNTSVYSPLREQRVLDGQSIKVEYRMTAVPGANQVIYGDIKYALMEPT